MRWGLIPFWGERTQHRYPHNAKAEIITTAPAFREAIKYRRCLVPADAFYEWQKLDAKAKQPFVIALKSGEPYALAGLWEKWKDRKAGAELLTFTVVTTDPNEVVQRCTTECLSSSLSGITTGGYSPVIPTVRRLRWPISIGGWKKSGGEAHQTIATHPGRLRDHLIDRVFRRMAWPFNQPQPKK
jgi:hypothetical protein